MINLTSFISLNSFEWFLTLCGAFAICPPFVSPVPVPDVWLVRFNKHSSGFKKKQVGPRLHRWKLPRRVQLRKQWCHQPAVVKLWNGNQNWTLGLSSNPERQSLTLTGFRRHSPALFIEYKTQWRGRSLQSTCGHFGGGGGRVESRHLSSEGVADLLLLLLLFSRSVDARAACFLYSRQTTPWLCAGKTASSGGKVRCYLSLFYFVFLSSWQR